MLDGVTPYPPAHTSVLLRQLNAYIPPPPFALVAVPFALLPWPLAIAAWSFVSVGAFCAALYLVGVRDWRLYPVAAASFPFVATLGFGQTEGLLALGLAAAWRWRDSSRGALALGTVIAAKLIVWPLVIWFLLTGRRRSAALAAATVLGILAVSWACLGLNGLATYPKLLAADAQAFANRTHSVAALFMHLGLMSGPSEVIGVLAALGMCALLVWRFGRGDEILFMAGVAASLLASPMLEMHYVTLLLIPLAVLRPRLDGLWVLVANVFWLSPHEPAHGWQILVVLAAVTSVIVRAPEPSRPADAYTSPRVMARSVGTA